MQIIVKDKEFTYMYDSSVNDKVVDGFLDEYYPPVDEIVDIAVSLLWNLYDKAAIARVLKEGIPAMDYDKSEDED